MRVLVLGVGGRLGSALVRANPGHTLIRHTRFDADITEAPALARFVTEARPEWVVNTVAFNNTEACEAEPGLALAVNALAPRALAAVCAGAGARLIHFSTDFVFDGRKGAPYTESDAPNPINVYAYSKYGGECFARAASGRNLVIRTAGLFGGGGSRSKGASFVDAVLALAEKPDPLRVVNDLTVSPTYTLDLAEKVWDLIGLNAPGGLYHLANTGGCTWHEFAGAVLKGAGVSAEVQAISSAAWPGKMPRSPDTRLASERLTPLGLKPLRPWPDALAAYLAERVAPK